MNWILLALVGAALLCPITMFGPMLLQRLGLRKRSGPGGMSCMGMGMNGGVQYTPPEANLEGLRVQRAAIDREIARVQASVNEAGESPDARGRSAKKATFS